MSNANVVYTDEGNPFYCSDYSKVRLNYSYLLTMKELKEEYNLDCDLTKNKVAIQVKRSIRDYFKRQKTDHWIIKGDYDGALLLIEFPEDIKTESDAEEYFLHNEYLSCRPSQYDCTGDKFTAWYKLFKRRGKWMCYHSIGIDV